jgi:NFU1 iron-sulfur cluster scaffold homolog, mitochondrial
MQRLRDAWLRALARVPAGNAAADGAWEAAARRPPPTGDAERAALADRTLKLRRAMADPTLIDELPRLSDEERFRRRNLQSAVEADDWSAEIDRQTADAAGPSAPAGILSPFDRRRRRRPDAAPAAAAAPATFDLEGVDAALDAVRPMLAADGGSCRVVSVDPASGDVTVAMEGACGACPSAAVTLQQGVDKALRDRFGPRLGRVVRAPAGSAAAGGGGGGGVTVAEVEELLEPILGAVRSGGGALRVASVEAAAGAVTLEYGGPPELVYGLELYLGGAAGVRTVRIVAPGAAAAAPAP